ncbi:MAG TPA: hypothetical protein VMU06_22365 [Stellaceae bacterium]|nr:hypothetical protein [Stellaceae bacterium]
MPLQPDLRQSFRENGIVGLHHAGLHKRQELLQPAFGFRALDLELPQPFAATGLGADGAVEVLLEQMAETFRRKEALAHVLDDEPV